MTNLSKCQYCSDKPIKYWGKTCIPVCERCYERLRIKYWKITGVWPDSLRDGENSNEKFILK